MSYKALDIVEVNLVARVRMNFEEVKTLIKTFTRN
jgi:hypothetical protein